MLLPLFAIILTIMPMQLNELIFDFGRSGQGQDWRVINDDVMGGISEGRVSLTDSSMIFTGQLSLENNGGFASVRTPLSDFKIDGLTTVELKVRGNGGEFALVFEDSRVFYQPTYRVRFVPKEEWQVLQFQLENMEESVLGEATGQTLGDTGKSEFIRIGITKYDKKTDPFTLEVHYIRVH